jgi:hypothetical protein
MISKYPNAVNEMGVLTVSLNVPHQAAPSYNPQPQPYVPPPVAVSNDHNYANFPADEGYGP